MKILRTAVVFLLIVTLLANIFVSATDNSLSAWAVREIGEAIELGFVPDDLRERYSSDITRAEFAEVAVRFLALQFRLSDHEVCDYYLNLPSRPMDASERQCFSDTTDVWVETAYLSGIVSGRGNGIFDPDSPITREEAAQMLYNTYRIYAEEENIVVSEIPDSFFDRPSISSWAEDAVAFAVKYGVMNGISESEFSPDTHYTREQCFVTFLRLYKNAPCGRLTNTAKNLWTYDEMVDDIVGAYSYVPMYTCDTETCTVLYGKQTADRTGRHRLWIVYRDGGRRQLREEFPYPDHVSLENFSLSEDSTELYCTQSNTGERYKILLETAEVEVLP